VARPVILASRQATPGKQLSKRAREMTGLDGYGSTWKPSGRLLNLYDLNSTMSVAARATAQAIPILLTSLKEARLLH